MNLMHRLAATANHDPDRVALHAEDAVVTYAGLQRRAQQVAGGLAHRGVRPGDRVALVADSSQSWVVAALYGIWWAGAVATVLNAQLTADEIAMQMDNAGACLAVAETSRALELAARAARRAAAVPDVVNVADLRHDRAQAVDSGGTRDATIFYTSGTTGTAKGATHTHRALLAHLDQLAAWYQVTSDDVLLQALPLYLLSVLVMGPLLSVHTGSVCRMLSRFDSTAVAEAVTTDRVTVMAAVPVLFWDLMELGPEAAGRFDLGSVRVLHFGGAPTPPSLRSGFEQRFGARLYQAYGATEAPNMVAGDPYGAAPRPGSVGRPMPHILLTVVDEEQRPLPAGAVGEICAERRREGSHAGLYEPMRCYWGDADATVAALRGGRLHLGDLGYLDPDGYLFLVDRKTDVIIRGGMNIYPRELEMALDADERIAECAVVGGPHPRYGEVPVAFVRVSGSPAPTREEVLAVVNPRLARYKQLTDVRIVEDFPRNAMGKILKRELRARLQTEGPSQPPR